jgi:O-antigen/teichoic acid export membrane protein
MSLAVQAESERALARKAVVGALALGARQVLVQAVNLLGVVLLARLLSPADFGIYAIVSFCQSLLLRFGDAGLGASLIREPREPTERDYRAIFSFQQVLVGSALLLFWLVAPVLTQAYRLSNEHTFTLRLVALGFFFTGLRAIPTIRLERALAFDRLAVVDVAEALTFNLLAVGLATRGLGAKSFAIAILARAAVGALVVQSQAPFRFALVWDFALVQKHLSFGLSFQAIGLVSLVKDSITPILVGLLLGAADVGYINWSQTLAAYAVMALMAFHRLYLPVFARAQHDRATLSRFVERTIWATNAVTAPLAVTTVVLFEPLTTLIFGTKWLVAKPLFLLLAFANLLVPTVTPLLGLFNALGRSRLALGFAVTWMVSTWLFGVPLVLLYGSLGYALGNVLVQLSNLLLFRVAKQLVPFRIVATVWRIWLSAATAGIVVSLVAARFTPTTLAELAAHVLGSLSLFVAALSLIDRANAVAAWRGLQGKP